MIRVGIIEDNNALRQSLEQLFNRTAEMKCTVSLSNLMNVVSDIQKINTRHCINGYWASQHQWH